MMKIFIIMYKGIMDLEETDDRLKETIRGFLGPFSTPAARAARLTSSCVYEVEAILVWPAERLLMKTDEPVSQRPLLGMDCLSINQVRQRRREGGGHHSWLMLIKIRKEGGRGVERRPAGRSPAGGGGLLQVVFTVAAAAAAGAGENTEAVDSGQGFCRGTDQFSGTQGFFCSCRS